jgi:flagellar biosynthetic protein FliR
MPHVVPYVLVTFRLAGAFLAAPMLLSPMIPARLRTLLVLMLAAAVYPMASDVVEAPAEINLFALLGLMLMEGLIGFCLGFIASIPMLALEMAGVIGGHQMGLSLARVYNPQADSEVDVVGQLYVFIAFAAYLTLGGIERVLAALMGTFTKVPVGGMATSDAPLELAAGLLDAGLSMALSVSAPVTAAVLLSAIVFGVIGKTMPQLNVMTVGFAVKMLAGLLLMALSVYAVGEASGTFAADMLSTLEGWAAGLGGGR